MTIEEYVNTTKVVNDTGEIKLLADLPYHDKFDFIIKHNPRLLVAKESKRWRMNNLYYIITKSQDKSVFKFNRAQEDLFEKYISAGYKKIIMLKSRQLGMTTFMSVWLTDEILFNLNTSGMQIAHQKDYAIDIFQGKVSFIINNLPDSLWTIIKKTQDKSNRVTFEYPDKSRSTMGVALSARSKTLNFLHVSELAKMAKEKPANATELVTGTFPSVSKQSNGLILIESTAEGAYGLFYEMYMSSFKRRKLITPIHTISEFFPVFYNWTWDDVDIKSVVSQVGIVPVSEMEQCEIDWAEYQQEYNLTDEQITYYYLKWIEAGRDIDKLNQEYPTTEMEAFVSTGANFFSSKKVFRELEALEAAEEANYSTKIFNGYSFEDANIKYTEKFDGLMIFEPCESGRKYIIGADVAEGIESGDYSTAVVVGYDKKIKAVYRGHLEPQEFEVLLRSLGQMYNNALMAVEYNKDGNWVNTELYNNRYPNIYYRTSFDDIKKVQTKFYGWRTDSKTRPIALNELKRYFNNCQVFPYRIVLDEMAVFVKDKRGKPQAQIGKHDDIIMAAAIAYAILMDRKDVQTSPNQVQGGYMHLLFG
jgi:hypothetical protein